MLELFPEGFAEQPAGEEVELVAFTDEAGAGRLRESFGAVDIVLATLALPTLGSLTRELDCRVVITSGYDAAHHPALPGFKPVARRTAENWAADLHARE